MKKKFFAVAVLVVILLSSFNYITLINFSEGSELDSPQIVLERKNSLELHNETELEKFATEENLTGDGSKNNPFIIKNYTFTAEDDSPIIYLKNIESHLIIIDSIIQNSTSQGIRLESTRNISLKNNQIKNVTTGIHIGNSVENMIKNNQIESEETGVRILDKSSDNVFYNNDLINCGFSLRDNRKKGNTHTIPTNNTINGDPVIYYPVMSNESISENIGQILLIESKNISISSLSLNKTTVGIEAINSEIVNIDNISVKNQKSHGIYLGYSENVTVENSTFKRNEIGIEISHTRNSTIQTNQIVNSSDRGIVLSSGDYTETSDDEILTRQNILKENKILSSTAVAIHIKDYSNENRIYQNIIVDNRKGHGSITSQGFSKARENLDDANLTNYWYSEEKLGNYWGNWDKNDSNRDGIIDEAYPIRGTEAEDKYPLSGKIGPPLNINSQPRDGKIILSWDEPAYSLIYPIENISLYEGINQEYLFSLSYSEYEDHLEEGPMDENLTDAFEEEGYELDDEAEISEEDDDEWTIIKKQEEIFIIRSEKDELNVYNREKLSHYQNFSVNEREFIHHNVSNDVEYLYTLKSSNEKYESIHTQVESVTPDGTPPEVVEYTPDTNDEVSVNTSIMITFSEEMQSGTVNISVEGIDGKTERLDENKYSFTPDEKLEISTEYSVKVLGRDLANNSLEGGSFEWNFETRSTEILEGQIFDKDGEPLERVLISSDGGNETLTGPEGRFEIELEYGDRRLSISKEGYQEKEIELEIAPENEKIDLEEEYGNEVKLEEIERSNDLWFWPQVVVGGTIGILGMIALALFYLRWEEKIPEEDEINEDESYEDISQEEFESWWDD